MNGLDSEKIDTIKYHLRQHPRGRTISQLASKLRMNRNLLAKYLDVLLFSGFVEMNVVGTAKVYFISHRVPISTMLEFSSDYILVLDAESRILQANSRLLTLLEWERDDLIGHRIHEIDHPFLKQVPVKNLPPDLSNFVGGPVEVPALFNDRLFYFSMKQVPMLFEDGSNGQTLIFEDTTKRRESEEKIRTYMLQMEFFSRKLEEFAELPPGADIYAAIGAGLDDLLPDAIVDVNAYDSLTKMLKKMAVFGNRVDEFIVRTRDNNCRWDACPAYGSVPEILGTGKLFHLPGKLHYASFEQIPVDAAGEIEREFNLGDFYSIGLVWRGTLLGNILFILREGDKIRNIPFIEIYARAASIALQRQIAEEAYKNSLRLSGQRRKLKKVPAAP
jgi:PAS domain S-box-containing protein